ncbi:MAG: molybdenum cofactor guanylyltransferase [Pirellula sp.]|jgi:molybdopterin-guanine dinucleotide biosynthesis protein A|nr:molybdenum cofactor guanylyltransferase [Pirellula sp.]
MSHFANEASPSRFAYILAGGKSSRFGSSKALVITADIPQIQRLAQELAADSWQCVAVSQSVDEFQSFGLRTIADHEPDHGPVAGILAGLNDLRSEAQSGSVWPWALFIPCDLWNWDARWTEGLRPPDIASCSGKIASETVLLVHFRAQRFSPFPCLIHRDALPMLHQSWDRGCRSMRQLFEELAPASLSRELSTEYLPESFNTLEELKRLRRERS